MLTNGHFVMFAFCKHDKMEIAEEKLLVDCAASSVDRS